MPISTYLQNIPEAEREAWVQKAIEKLRADGAPEWTILPDRKDDPPRPAVAATAFAMWEAEKARVHDEAERLRAEDDAEKARAYDEELRQRKGRRRPLMPYKSQFD